MKNLAPFILSALLIVVSACDVTNVSETTDGPDLRKDNNLPALLTTIAGTESSSTIVDIAVDNDDFNILVEAVLFAGLDGVLSGKRQFTVFAPTDEAFVNLLDELGLTAEELLSEERKELVTDILLYHVAAGNRMSGDVVSSKQIRTQQGSFIKIMSEDDSFFTGNEDRFAELIAVDIEASNGVIHVIDTVMLPPEEFNPGNRAHRGNGRR